MAKLHLWEMTWTTEHRVGANISTVVKVGTGENLVAGTRVGADAKMGSVSNVCTVFPFEMGRQ